MTLKEQIAFIKMLPTGTIVEAVITQSDKRHLHGEKIVGRINNKDNFVCLSHNNERAKGGGTPLPGYLYSWALIHTETTEVFVDIKEIRFDSFATGCLTAGELHVRELAKDYIVLSNGIKVTKETIIKILNKL